VIKGLRTRLVHCRQRATTKCHDYHRADIPKHGDVYDGRGHLPGAELRGGPPRPVDREATHAEVSAGPLMSSANGPSGVVLTVRGLLKRFGRLDVLNGIDLTVRQGEVAFIIGPSGGGKTTLLRCINFLEIPDGGTIEFDGKRLCHNDERGFH